MSKPSTVTNIVLDADYLLSIVPENYDLPDPTHCELIRTGFNHNYLIQTTDRKFVLRVYLNGKPYIRHTDDFRFELELLDVLSKWGIPVVRPVANKQGEWLTTYEGTDEVRSLALFHFVDGIELHMIEFDDPAEITPQLEHLGEIVARIHLATSQFQSHYHRYHLDLDHLLDRSLHLLEQHLRERDMGDATFFKPTAEEIRRNVQQLPITDDTYGPIHADLNAANILWDPKEGLTIIDFDHGGYGWRSYDFAALAIDISEIFSPILKGYESVRPLSDLERQLIPTFVKLRWIWDIGDMLSFMPLWGEQPTDDYLEECVKKLHNLR